MTEREAWDHIKANRPPDGQVMFGPLREAIDTIEPLVLAALQAAETRLENAGSRMLDFIEQSWRAGLRAHPEDEPEDAGSLRGRWFLRGKAFAANERAVLAAGAVPPPDAGLRDQLVTLRHQLDEWAISTEFTRNCKNPVDAGDQMALRDAHELLVEFDGVIRALEHTAPPDAGLVEAVREWQAAKYAWMSAELSKRANAELRFTTADHALLAYPLPAPGAVPADEEA